MRIARQALAVDFLAEVEQLFFGQAALEVCAGIDAGRRMALDIQQVATAFGRIGMPEMVEASRKHVGDRSERADMPAQIAAILDMLAVRLDHHRHRVPAHVGAQAPFELEVARAALFIVGLDRIDIGRRRRERHVDVVLSRMLEQFLDQEVGALRPLAGNDRRQGVDPFAGFLRIGIGGGAVDWKSTAQAWLTCWLVSCFEVGSMRSSKCPTKLENFK